MRDLSAANAEAFLEMMSAERGAAENTLEAYRRDLDDASRRAQVSGNHAGQGPVPKTSAVS
jgi:integrase/recombinase XerD